MYINPFWVGVAATILAELALIVGAGVIMFINESRKNKKKNNNK